MNDDDDVCRRYRWQWILTMVFMCLNVIPIDLNDNDRIK